MANANSPTGFTPIKNLDGTSWNGKTQMFFVPSTDANNMFIGDLVDLAGSSNTAIQNGFKIGTLPTVQLITAGATNRILGSIVDIYKPTDIDDSLRKRYRVASTNTIVMVALANNTIFSAQNDGTSVATSAGTNCNVTLGSGGSTSSGYSSHQVDTSEIGNDATYQLTLLRLRNVENNDVGQYAVDEVFINLPRISPDTVGV